MLKDGQQEVLEEQAQQQITQNIGVIFLEVMQKLEKVQNLK